MPTPGPNASTLCVLCIMDDKEEPAVTYLEGSSLCARCAGSAALMSRVGRHKQTRNRIDNRRNPDGR